mgnify:CR=1 FL=1
MQTSLGAFFRGLLMLVCATSFVMAALCGPLLSDALSSISPGRINCASKKAGVRGADSNFELLAPPGGASTRPADPMVPGWYRQEPRRDWIWPNEQPRLGNQWANSSATEAVASSPGRFQGLAAESEPSAGPASESYLARNGTFGGKDFFGSNDLQEASQCAAIASGCSDGQSSQFEDIHSRLQRLGVTYYLLERQHCQRPLYRFYCRLPEADKGGHGGQFEAVDEYPVRAMWRVLLEVERYRCGRELAGAAVSAY